uniref:Uncharacterized protein n=1 Tax=Eutreptiella gymnastica TaxID=73025 RepID=A0A7S4LMQ9_9EUGL
MSVHEVEEDIVVFDDAQSDVEIEPVMEDVEVSKAVGRSLLKVSVKTVSDFTGIFLSPSVCDGGVFVSPSVVDAERSFSKASSNEAGASFLRASCDGGASVNEKIHIMAAAEHPSAIARYGSLVRISSEVVEDIEVLGDRCGSQGDSVPVHADQDIFNETVQMLRGNRQYKLPGVADQESVLPRGRRNSHILQPIDGGLPGINPAALQEEAPEDVVLLLQMEEDERETLLEREQSTWQETVQECQGRGLLELPKISPPPSWESSMKQGQPLTRRVMECRDQESQLRRISTSPTPGFRNLPAPPRRRSGGAMQLQPLP